jgi:predicted amidohydrolase YtcJ
VEALAMFIRDAAKVMQWDEIGSIAKGNYADIVIVDQDPITCEVSALKNTRVLRTIFDGRTVYDSGDLD